MFLSDFGFCCRLSNNFFYYYRIPFAIVDKSLIIIIIFSYE